MPKNATLHFSIEEYAARLARTRQSMADRGIISLAVIVSLNRKQGKSESPLMMVKN